MKSFRSAAAAIVLALTAATPAAVLAQSGTSTITGIVADSSGAAIPGATVRVVNEDTGAAVEVDQRRAGLYRATALVPGAYRLEVALDGFETAVRRIVLEAGQTAAIDVTLSPGAISLNRWS